MSDLEDRVGQVDQAPQDLLAALELWGWAMGKVKVMDHSVAWWSGPAGLVDLAGPAHLGHLAGLGLWGSDLALESVDYRRSVAWWLDPADLVDLVDRAHLGHLEALAPRPVMALESVDYRRSVAL